MRGRRRNLLLGDRGAVQRGAGRDFTASGRSIRIMRGGLVRRDLDDVAVGVRQIDRPGDGVVALLVADTACGQLFFRRVRPRRDVRKPT